MSLLKKGFTLSEMLIAMGIIGVVAAMTIPNMMKDTTGKQLETKLILFTTSLEKLAKQNADVDFLDKDQLRDFLEANMMFDDTSALGYNQKRTLRDGTALKLLTSGDGNTYYKPKKNDNDDSGITQTDLDASRIIRFYPNVTGLVGRDYFDFYISKDGSIFPDNRGKTGSDYRNQCALDLYAKGYKTKDVYKTGPNDSCKK